MVSQDSSCDEPPLHGKRIADAAACGRRSTSCVDLGASDAQLTGTTTDAVLVTRVLPVTPGAGIGSAGSVSSRTVTDL
jgi:hypothetical protein